MIVKNGFVFQEDKTFVKKDLYIENGRIAEDTGNLTDTSVIDVAGLLVLPGLVDVHSHGAVGCDFSDGDEEGIKKILAYEYAHGITTYCPTSMTMEKDKLLRIFKMMGEWADCPWLDYGGVNHPEQDCFGLNHSRLDHMKIDYCELNYSGLAHVAGIHMEGPFLDVSRKGAHREECLLEADADFFRECNEACGNHIRLVTMAPNIKGAMEFIREFHRETVISLGHTGAGYSVAKEALAAGANHVTHLYNAMAEAGHRDPGLIGAAAEEEGCMAELICDDVHVHESMVRAAFKLFPGRIVLISDSIRATGMEDGTYDLGGQLVTVNGKKATLPDGTIAGSVANLYDCMRTAVSFGIPVGEAIAAATMNPAKSIGIYNEAGSLAPGKRADILLADKDLNLVRVI